MKKFILLGFAVGILAVFGIAAIPNSNDYVPDNCDVGSVAREIRLGIINTTKQICYESGVLTFSYFENGLLIQSRPANVGETERYAEKVYSDSIDTAESNVRNAVDILRTWEAQAAQTVIDWDGLNSTQKDTRLKILIDRTGKFYGYYADLIISQNLNK